jgi:hypothetical protein
MIKIYEVRTGSKVGNNSYRVAAKDVQAAMDKVTKNEIEPFDVGEYISEVLLLASESK